MKTEAPGQVKVWQMKRKSREKLELAEIFTNNSIKSFLYYFQVPIFLTGADPGKGGSKASAPLLAQRKLH